tara:strand:- start:358 stop:1164 length:807 start_codon:yes stop_codon:yes gene_type:complete
MKFLHKFIVVTLIVSVVVLLICYDIHKTRTNNIENFTEFQTTIITDFSPKDGDGSTVVTMTGRGLQHIQEVLFNDTECVILEDRTSSKIQIIPPALSEIGMTIEEIRKTIEETGSGMPVDVKLMKKEGGTTPKTAVLLPDITFFYIDKGATWKNQCPKDEEGDDEGDTEVEGPSFEATIDTSQGEASFKEGTDLYFLHVTLPEMEDRLNGLIKEMEDKLEEQKLNNPGLEDINNLKEIQSLDSLFKYKQEMNILRYNIHKNIKDVYGY